MIAMIARNLQSTTTMMALNFIPVVKMEHRYAYMSVHVRISRSVRNDGNRKAKE
jgi:hypothetical protein